MAVTAGPVRHPLFLERLARLIGQASVVASERVCTTTFYASLLGRPFMLLRDAPMQTTPVDPDEGMAGDSAWLAEHYPQYASPTVDREVAWRELGGDCLLSPEALRRLLDDLTARAVREGRG